MKGKPTGYWGKLKRDDETGEVQCWHPLDAHCADVAAVTNVLLSESILRDRLQQLHGERELTDEHVDRLCVLSALHDAGKFNHGFQERAGSPDGPFVGHVGEIVNAVNSYDEMADAILDALDVFALADWFETGEREKQLQAFLLMVFGHHGRPVAPDYSFKSSRWKPRNDRDPIRGIADLRQRTEEWFPGAFENNINPFSGCPEFQHAFNGILTLADWIASDEEFFPYADNVDGYFSRAVRRAEDAVTQLGLDPSGIRRILQQQGSPEFSTIAPAEYSPRPVQNACGDLENYSEGSLSIMESDTGSGKTEAALLRFAELFHDGLVDGMYFALPTRTAATQLHGRVIDAMEQAFPDQKQRPPVVLAVPGYLSVDREQGQRLAPFRVLWDDDDSWRWHARGWAAESPKRYLAGTVAVGTVDQVLLSALQVKHAHLRASSLLRHFLVVDEVHASDTYMDRLLETVLDYHLEAGGHAMLMSATLGSSARRRFLRGPRSDVEEIDDALERSYPLVTQVDAERTQQQDLHASSVAEPKKIKVESEPVSERPQEVARLAHAAARRGARVLVIRNTVPACVQTQQAMEDIAGKDVSCLFAAADVPTPHHARYAPSDRDLLDRAIERDFGKESQRDGVVAIATQTVQQSLDLDADYMISDLCPIDVMLQRVGRLHRHPEERPADSRPGGFKTPHLTVVVPEDRDLGGCISENGKAFGPNGLGTVYPDLRMLEAACRLVEEHDLWTIPGMNRELVERGTHPDVLHEIAENAGEPWLQHQKQVLGTRGAEHAHAGVVTIRRDVDFGEPASLFPRDLDDRIKTRLGTDDRRVEFDPPVAGPYGQRVEVLTVPEYSLPDEYEDETPENVVADDGQIRFEFAGTQFVYDRLGLRTLES